MPRKKAVPNGEEKKVRKPAQGGKSRGKRKLTDDQVLAIVAAYNAGGVTMTNLGKQFEVSAPTISSIVNGRTYAWLTKISPAAPAEIAEAA